MYIDISQGVGYTGGMSAVLKMLMFILTAGVMPALSGLLPAGLLPQKDRRIPTIIMTGYLMTFALFEVIGIPVLLFTPMGDFRLLAVLFTIMDLALIAAGMIVCRRRGGIRLPEVIAGKKSRREDSERQRDGETIILWLIFLLLLAFELYKSYTMASYDGDDAYYVAQSLQTWTTGTMYHYVPYTGYSTPLDGRHAFALIPMWIAWIAKLSGTHPTIVTHSMMPLVLIPAADLCFYNAVCGLTADEPVEKQKRMIPAFMIILAVLQIFGNVSIYTPQTFLLMRTWQGKTVFANLILPSALVLLLRLCRTEKAGRYCWLMLVVLNTASGFTTSLAPALLSGLLLLTAVFGAFLWKRWKLIPEMLAACIPDYLYLMLLLWVVRGGRG